MIKTTRNAMAAAIAAASALLGACGGGGGGGRDLSTGLKIFMTDETHSPDFAGDADLTGADGVARADDFCNRSSTKPDDAVYKALIVAGGRRDGASLTDWVLQPNTTYYRVYEDVVIGTTTDAAIFDVVTSQLTNSIGDCGTNPDTCSYSGRPEVLTGIADVSDFSANGEDCDGWSGTSGMARFGAFIESDANAFRNGQIFCSNPVPAHLYCVEQVAVGP